MDLKTIAVIIAIPGGILAIFGIIGYFKGYWGWFADKTKSFFRSSKSTLDIPKKTIRIIPRHGAFEIRWHMISKGGEPAMQIRIRFAVTNIAIGEILLVSTEMKKPKAFGTVLVRKEINDHESGQIPLPPGQTTIAESNFLISPPFKKEDESFKASIAIIDQFGNKHWIKRLEIPYL